MDEDSSIIMVGPTKEDRRLARLREADISIQCFELRKTGLSEEEIALGLGITVKEVSKYVAAVVKDKKKGSAVYAQEQREIIMARVEKLIDSVWDEAVDGNLFAVDRVIRLNDQAIALSGAKTDRVDITSGGKPLEQINSDTIRKVLDEAAREVATFERSKMDDE